MIIYNNTCISETASTVFFPCKEKLVIIYSFQKIFNLIYYTQICYRTSIIFMTTVASSDINCLWLNWSGTPLTINATLWAVFVVLHHSFFKCFRFFKSQVLLFIILSESLSNFKCTYLHDFAFIFIYFLNVNIWDSFKRTCDCSTFVWLICSVFEFTNISGMVDETIILCVDIFLMLKGIRCIP